MVALSPVARFWGPPVAYGLAGGTVIAYQLTLSPHDGPCWFYDFNRGEHSFSEWATLIFYGLAAVLIWDRRAHFPRRFAAVALALVTFLALEEANYGQVFTQELSYWYADAEQRSLHTQTLWDDRLYLYEILVGLTFFALPLIVAPRLPRHRRGAVWVPAALCLTLLFAVEDWEMVGHQVDGIFLCSACPEEVLETLLAATMGLYAFLLGHARPFRWH